METNHDLYLMLGRLDGKVDALVQLHSSTQSRLDQIEARLANAEQSLAQVTGQGSTNRTWLSNVLSTVAVFVSAIGAYFGIKM